MTYCGGAPCSHNLKVDEQGAASGVLALGTATLRAREQKEGARAPDVKLAEFKPVARPCELHQPFSLPPPPHQGLRPSPFSPTPLCPPLRTQVPGDGRELVVADSHAVKVRAEDGRAVTRADISPFIDHLPFGRRTTDFSTADASGSTSQAAGIVEALEAGCSTLLLDEDTCATNFIIRDERMARLVAPDREPIRPFVSRVRPLWEERKVSTIMVMGGSGDFFESADCVLMFDCYSVSDVTARAKAIAAALPAATHPTPQGVFSQLPRRCPAASGLRPGLKVSAGRSGIRFGDEIPELDLTHVEQICEHSQVRPATAGHAPTFLLPPAVSFSWTAACPAVHAPGRPAGGR